MRKLFWMIFLFGFYVWTITSGNDTYLLEKGRLLYEQVLHWLADADLDFQLDPKKKSVKKARTRRWD